MQTDAVALDYAQAYVASRAETTVRCDAITLDLYTANYNTGIIAALTLDYFDPVTITTTQPGSSTLTKTLQVFGVGMSITPNSWRVSFTTLEPIIDAFILDLYSRPNPYGQPNDKPAANGYGRWINYGKDYELCPSGSRCWHSCTDERGRGYNYYS